MSVHETIVPLYYYDYLKQERCVCILDIVYKTPAISYRVVVLQMMSLRNSEIEAILKFKS